MHFINKVPIHMNSFNMLKLLQYNKIMLTNKDQSCNFIVALPFEFDFFAEMIFINVDFGFFIFFIFLIKNYIKIHKFLVMIK